MRREIDQNQYCMSTDTAKGGAILKYLLSTIMLYHVV